MTYKKVCRDDSSLIKALNELVEKHPSIGFWKCYYRLRRKGLDCNHKRLYRVYTMLKLNIRRKPKRRIPERVKEPLLIPEGMNKSWKEHFHYLLMPLVGALTVGVLWINLEATSLTLGLVWASLGGAYLWYLIRRYRKVPLYEGDRTPVSET